NAGAEDLSSVFLCGEEVRALGADHGEDDGMIRQPGELSGERAQRRLEPLVFGGERVALQHEAGLREQRTLRLEGEPLGSWGRGGRLERVGETCGDERQAPRPDGFEALLDRGALVDDREDAEAGEPGRR